jgi:hypothetical protein
MNRPQTWLHLRASALGARESIADPRRRILRSVSSVTLKGSIFGLAAFFVGAILVGCAKWFQMDRAFHKSHPGPGQTWGIDLVTLFHNQTVWRLGGSRFSG